MPAKNKINCILLIDDDEPTNFLNQMILESFDIANHIRIAENGSKALEYLKKSAGGDEDYPCPDMIFLDINMPAMNGWEFLEYYATIDANHKADVVVVMLTTSLNPDDKTKADENPDVTGFESKPLTPEKLQKLLGKYFPKIDSESGDQ